MCFLFHCHRRVRRGQGPKQIYQQRDDDDEDGWRLHLVVLSPWKEDECPLREGGNLLVAAMSFHFGFVLQKLLR